MRQTANVNVYLVLLQGEQILLSLRTNTGYEDLKWSLVAGHVENNESATDALIREAAEEIGIIIDARDLTVSHVMQRKSDRENVDIFISCARWKNKIVNKEPEKCGDLKFFELLNINIGHNIIDYIVTAINYIKNNIFYSEYGY